MLRVDQKSLNCMVGHENFGVDMAQVAARRLPLSVGRSFHEFAPEEMVVGKKAVGHFLGIVRSDDRPEIAVPPLHGLIGVRRARFGELVDISGENIAFILSGWIDQRPLKREQASQPLRVFGFNCDKKEMCRVSLRSNRAVLLPPP